MSKRNHLIIETKESNALKALRINTGFSLRMLSDKMNLSKTRVHQIETGRDQIEPKYIENFLLALDLSWDDWKKEIAGKDEFSMGLYRLRFSL
jgi:transcriptional regulator with XRE-family HTH domain